jgi:glycosyltransferase involved in cell wall biosynthesis
VPRRELPSRLSNLDAVVFFQKEGVGLAELQVMAAGKVIVCSSEGEMPRVIEHMKNGILCRPNGEDYVRAIELIGNDPVLRERIGMEARDTVLRDFNLEKLGQKWLFLCSEVVQEGGWK